MNGKIKRMIRVLLRLDVRYQLLHVRLIIPNLNVLKYVQKIWRKVVVIDQSIAKFIHAQKM